MRILLLTLGVLSAFALARSQSSPIDETESPLEELEWLVGHWRGEGLGGHVEETWTRESGGTMIGMFRLVVQGRTTVTELITIEASKGAKPVYRFKHFSVDLEAWEKKPLTYDGVELEEGYASFLSREVQPGKPRRLLYEQVSDEEMTVTVVGSDVDASGEPSSFVLELTRMPMDTPYH